MRCCLGLLLLAGLAPAADWPQWRGPSRDGICTEMALQGEWPMAGPALVWVAKERGEGYSTPTISGGRVYGMGHRAGDEIVWAIDVATGREVWHTRIAAASGEDGGFPGPRCSPALADGKLIALGLAGQLTCLDAATGKTIWDCDLKAKFGGRVMSPWGFSESPLIDGDRVIVTPGGPDAAVVALQLATGSTLWASKIPGHAGAGYASPVIGKVGDRKYYATWLSNKLVGVDANTGTLQFEYSAIANTTANIPTPIVRDDYLFCSTGYSDGGSALLRLEPEKDRLRAREVWRKPAKELQNHHGGCVLVGEHLYFGHGHNQGFPVCVEFLTGKKVWGPDRGPGTGSAAVLATPDRLYLRYQDGVMALLEVSATERKVRSKFTLPHQSKKPSWPHPVIADGRLYIRDQDVLMCFDVRATR